MITEAIVNKSLFTQRISSQIYMYEGNFLNTSYFEIIDGVVYYTIQQGYSMDGTLYKLYEYWIRYSSLCKMNIDHEMFPPKTWFKCVNRGFASERSALLNKWFDDILYKNLGNEFLLEAKKIIM